MNVKEIIRKLSLMVIVILLMCNFSTGQTEVFRIVPPERVPVILNAISSRVHQNFLQIHSFEGEIKVSRQVVYKEKAKDIFEKHTDAIGKPPNKIMKLTESTTTFRCDLEKGLYYTKASRETPSSYVDMEKNGRDLGTKSIPWYNISVLTPEYYLHSSPSRMRNGYPVQRRGVKEEINQECLTCKQHPVFDPKKLFNAGTPVWLSYPQIVERIEKEGEYIVDEYHLKVEQRELDGEVQYRVHEPIKIGPFGENMWEIKTYSADAGYNMISSERTHADGTMVRRNNLEYQSFQGVYIPSNAIYESFDPNDGSLRSRKEQIFKNVRINTVIPEETFTYKNLDFENGDKFTDKTLDKEYTYQDEELVPVEKKSKQ